MMFKLVSARVVRLTLSPLLALWVAGVGCLLGCEINILGAEHQPAQLAEIVSGDACSSAKSHDCCSGKSAKAHAKESSSVIRDALPSTFGVVTPGPTGSMGGCPLAVNATAAITKVRSSEAAGPALASDGPISPATTAHQSRITTHLHLPNGDHTYLRCCVFLI